MNITCIVEHITIIDCAIMRGSARWFLIVLHSPIVMPKVKIIHKYWYSFTQTTLNLIVFAGRGQQQVINKLNFTVAITFFSVTFFHMIKCTYAFIAIYKRFLAYTNCNSWCNKWMYSEENFIMKNDVRFHTLRFHI